MSAFLLWKTEWWDLRMVISARKGATIIETYDAREALKRLHEERARVAQHNAVLLGQVASKRFWSKVCMIGVFGMLIADRKWC